MPIYYKYAPDGSNLLVLSYVDDYVFWHISEELGQWFVDTLGKIFHANLLVYAHWSSIRTSQLKDYSLSVYQARHATDVVPKYLDNSTIKQNYKYHKTNLPHDMIFTKKVHLPVINK